MKKEPIEYIGAMRLLIQHASWRDRFTNPNGERRLCSGRRHGQRRLLLAIMRTVRLGDRIQMMLMLILVLYDGISGQYLRLKTVVDLPRFAMRQPPAALPCRQRLGSSLVYVQTSGDMCWLLLKNTTCSRHRSYPGLVRSSGTSIISSDLALGKDE